MRKLKAIHSGFPKKSCAKLFFYRNVSICVNLSKLIIFMLTNGVVSKNMSYERMVKRFITINYHDRPI